MDKQCQRDGEAMLLRFDLKHNLIAADVDAYLKVKVAAKKGDDHDQGGREWCLWGALRARIGSEESDSLSRGYCH